MKKILLLTDFSDIATNAANYTTQLANELELDITLLHVYQVYSSTGSFISVEQFMLKDIQQDLGKNLKHIRNHLKPGQKAIAKHLKGEIIPTISKVAEEPEFDLVIMGNHGDGRRTSLFWGSTTSGVIHKTKADILAIPEAYIFEPIESIVLILDDECINSEPDLSVLNHITQTFGAKLWLYHDNPKQTGLPSHFASALDACEYEYYAEHDPAESKNIMNFLQEKKADLVSILKHPEGFWDRFFHSSLELHPDDLFSSPIPLLVLKPRLAE